ncbi:MAG: shufflon system plasmid conjugative transfer pilus tip adhesin PilV [Oxalobacter sp.]|nr:shufflon system plasmid conjugative transfer pilus tip adhesin PilV [Oxalobacter sp.]
MVVLTRKIRQKGISLLETLLVIGIALMVTSIIIGSLNLSLNAHKNRFASEHMMAFSAAMKRYIGVYSGHIANTVTTAQPFLITRNMLVGEGLLPDNFSLRNAYGQAVCGVVTRSDDNSIHAFAISEGGRVLEDHELASIVGLIGGEGGALYAGNAGTVRGSSGSWSIASNQITATNQLGANCAGEAGAIAAEAGHFAQKVSLNAGLYADSYLSRNSIDGHDEANRMDTDLDMNNHSIVNVGNLQVTGTLSANEIVATERLIGGEYLEIDGLAAGGTACSSKGLVGIDNDGNLLKCTNGIWSSFSSVPTGMISFFNLPSCPTGWVEANGQNNTRDMRGMFARSRDFGRGMDADGDRAVGHYQGDAIRNIEGRWSPGEHGGRSGKGYTVTGAMRAMVGGDPTEKSGGGPGAKIHFDASRQVNTASDNRPKNVAMLACQKR